MNRNKGASLGQNQPASSPRQQHQQDVQDGDQQHDAQDGDQQHNVQQGQDQQQLQQHPDLQQQHPGSDPGDEQPAVAKHGEERKRERKFGIFQRDHQFGG